MDTKLSIIMIARNQSREVARNLEAFRCVYPDWASSPAGVELIISDDASDDDHLSAMIDSVAECRRHTGVGQLEHSPEWRGVGGARNLAFFKAKGEYVWFVDGDDQVCWHAIPAILAMLERWPGVPALAMTYYSVSPDGSEERISMVNNPPFKVWQCGANVWNKVVRSDLVPYFRERAWNEDIDWWMRLCCDPDMDNWQPMDYPAYRYFRLRPGSITATGRYLEDIDALVNVLAGIRKQAMLAGRPKEFVNHLDFLIRENLKILDAVKKG